MIPIWFAGTPGHGSLTTLPHHRTVMMMFSGLARNRLISNPLLLFYLFSAARGGAIIATGSIGTA